MSPKTWKLDRTSTCTGHLIFQIWKPVMLTAVDFTSNRAAHHKQSHTSLLFLFLRSYCILNKWKLMNLKHFLEKQWNLDNQATLQLIISNSSTKHLQFKYYYNNTELIKTSVLLRKTYCNAAKTKLLVSWTLQTQTQTQRDNALSLNHSFTNSHNCSTDNQPLSCYHKHQLHKKPIRWKKLQCCQASNCYNKHQISIHSHTHKRLCKL